MAVSYQLVVDCASRPMLAHFWAEALGYVGEAGPELSAVAMADPEGNEFDVS